MINVLIIDDDPFVTASLKTILESTEEIQVIGIGHSADDAIELYQTLQPDVLLTDIRMGHHTGITEIVDTFTQMMAPAPEMTFSQTLTERELQIIKEVATGKNNKEIAETLFLSDGTVRNYISQLLEKLALRDRTQLAIYYYQHLRKS